MDLRQALIVYVDIPQLRCTQVLELPPGAELLASSATAPNEVWTVRDRVLAFQGHPEMAPEEMLAKVHSTLSSNGCVPLVNLSPPSLLKSRIYAPVGKHYKLPQQNSYVYISMVFGFLGAMLIEQPLTSPLCILG